VWLERLFECVSLAFGGLSLSLCGSYMFRLCWHSHISVYRIFFILHDFCRAHGKKLLHIISWLIWEHFIDLLNIFPPPKYFYIFFATVVKNHRENYHTILRKPYKNLNCFTKMSNESLLLISQFIYLTFFAISTGIEFILSVQAFPGNQIHDLGVASASCSISRVQPGAESPDSNSRLCFSRHPL